MSFADKLKQRNDAPETVDLTVGHAKTLHANDDKTDAWNAARRRGIGGSDIATIIGLQPYGNTREQLWKEKTGRAERRIENAATRFGSLIESYIRLWLRLRAEDTPARYGRFAGLVNFPAQLAHPDRDWQRANVDGIVADTDGLATAGVEIKQSAKKHGARSERWTDEGVHQYHYPQIQHYLEVTGLDEWYYVYVHIPGDREMLRQLVEKFVPDTDCTDCWLWLVDYLDPTVRTVERDDDYIDYITDAERDFWRHVEDDTPPGEFLPEGVVEVEDNKLAKLLDRYGRAHATIKQASAPKSAKQQKEEAKDAIKQRAQALAAAHGDAKEIRIKGTDDAVKWNGRGYWMAKPAKRNPEPDTDTVEVPF